MSCTNPWALPRTTTTPSASAIGASLGYTLQKPRPRDVGDVLMLDVGQRVQPPHLRVGDLAAQLGQRCGNRGISLDDRCSDDRSCLIGREVASVVAQSK